MASRWPVWTWLLLAVLSVEPAVAARGGASRTRPSGGTPSAGSRAQGSASRPGSAPRVASGKATYGYYHGGGGHYPYYPYWYPDSVWGYYPYFSFYWGYPWWGYGYPYYYGAYPASPVQVYTDARYAPVSIETDVVPNKATVRLDGDPVGIAKDYNGRWDQLWVSPGRHVIEFEAAGRQTLRLEIEARPGATYRFDYELQPGEGLDPRSAAAPASPEATATLEGSGDRDAALEAAPPAAPAAIPGGLGRGFLRFDVLPSDAAIYLDGEFLASGRELSRLHGAIPVAAGVHRLEVVKPGWAPWSGEVAVEEGGAPAVVKVELERSPR